MRIPSFALLGLLLTIGCAKKPSDNNMDRPEQPKIGENTNTTGANDTEWRTTYVDVGEGIPQQCGFGVPRTYFSYDSDNLDAEARTMVDSLAECMTTGPLKDQAITLVGHADPTGTDQYNKQLGMSRADSVRDALVKKGVDASRITIVSKGEMAADMDPRGWRYDRRVDVRLSSEMPTMSLREAREAQRGTTDDPTLREARETQEAETAGTETEDNNQ